MKVNPRALEKGKPRFGKWSDEKLDQHIGLIRDLLFAYEPHNGFKFEHDVLNKIWKDITNHQMDRLAVMPDVKSVKEPNTPATVKVNLKVAKPKFKIKGR